MPRRSEDLVQAVARVSVLHQQYNYIVYYCRIEQTLSLQPLLLLLQVLLVKTACADVINGRVGSRKLKGNGR